MTTVGVHGKACGILITPWRRWSLQGLLLKCLLLGNHILLHRSSCQVLVHVDIPDQFFKIRVFLTQNGSTAVLKKLSMSLVFSVEPACVARKQPAYENGDGGSAGSQQQVHVIIEYCPGKAIDACLWKQKRQTVYKIFSVIIASEYLPPFDSQDNDMLQRPWRIYSCFG